MFRPAFVAIALLFSANAAAETTTVAFIHFNDLDRVEEKDGAGGLARVKTVIDQARAAYPHVVVTHGGDTLAPSLLSGFDEGAHIIDLLGDLGLDAMVLGNHEFDFGPDVLAQRVAEARFPILSANTQTSDGAPLPGVLARRMVRAGPFKIGLFGLTTTTAPQRASPGDVAFRSVEATAEAESKALRAAGADLVVAVAHTRVDEDERLRAAGAPDMILGGDDHDLRAQYRGRTLFVESFSQGVYVAKIVVTLTRDDGETAWRPSLSFIHTADVAPDAAMQARVDAYMDALAEELDRPAGPAPFALDSRRQAVRGGAAAIGGLIAEAMRRAAGPDVALMNGGGIRGGRVYDAGAVLSKRDVHSELPFRNRIVVLEISGADLRAALEHGVGAVERLGGRFPQVAGMQFAFSATRPVGQRVGAVTVDGAPLDDQRLYRLATNNFLARGGDGYAALKDQKVLEANVTAFIADAVIAHLGAR